MYPVHHFLLKETDGSKVRVNDKVRNDHARRLGEQVRLTMAMDHAPTEAMREIEELHRYYDEQERMIVTQTLALTMRETAMEELRMTPRTIRRRFPREMPLRSMRPN
jgi:hypothetical protein